MESQKKPNRSRMTAQSKVNIEAAIKAQLIPENDGYGYTVELIGDQGSAFVENRQGPIVYSSMATAKAAVKKHNSSLTPALKPTI